MSVDRSRNRRVWVVVGAVVSVLLLVAALRGIDAHELVRILKRGHVALLVASGLLMVLSYVVRAHRWKLLLSQGGNVPVKDVFAAVCVGYLGNNTLPARAGEALRAAMLARRAAMRTSYVLATALSERAGDFVIISMVVVASAILMPDLPSWLVAIAPIVGLLSVAGVLAVFATQLWRRIASRLIELLPARYRARAATAVEHFLDGIALLHNRRILLRFGAWSVVILTLDGLAIVAASVAFDTRVSLLAALVLLVALTLSSAVPSTPGYIGVYQFVAVQVLPPFGLTRTEAIALVLGLQAVNIVVVLAFGAWGLWALRVRSRGIDPGQESTTRETSEVADGTRV